MRVAAEVRSHLGVGYDVFARAHIGILYEEPQPWVPTRIPEAPGAYFASPSVGFGGSSGGAFRVPPRLQRPTATRKRSTIDDYVGEAFGAPLAVTDPYTDRIIELTVALRDEQRRAGIAQLAGAFEALAHEQQSSRLRERAMAAEQQSAIATAAQALTAFAYEHQRRATQRADRQVGMQSLVAVLRSAASTLPPEKPEAVRPRVFAALAMAATGLVLLVLAWILELRAPAPRKLRPRHRSR